ncbi:hypothetical protein VTI74DRAFT_7014 [Chaetomium olivicolor]
MCSPHDPQPGHGVTPKPSSTRRSYAVDDVELSAVSTVPEPSRRSDPGPPFLRQRSASTRNRPKSLPVYARPRPVRTPPPWAFRDVQCYASIRAAPKQRPPAFHSAQPREVALSPSPLIWPSERHQEGLRCRRGISQVLPASPGPHTQPDGHSEMRLREFSIEKCICGLHHEVLEIQQVRRGNPVLVITEKSRRSSIIEFVNAESDSDSPISGREWFQLPGSEHHGPEHGDEFYPAPLNITRRGQAGEKELHVTAAGTPILPSLDGNKTNRSNSGLGLVLETLLPELPGSEPMTTPGHQNTPTYTHSQFTTSPPNTDGTSTSVPNHGTSDITPFTLPQRLPPSRRFDTTTTTTPHQALSRSYSTRHKTLPPLPSPTPPSAWSPSPPPSPSLPPQRTELPPSSARYRPSAARQAHPHRQRQNFGSNSADAAVFRGSYLKLFSCLP